MTSSNKIRSKNDTWTSEELRKALKEEDSAGKTRHRDKSSSGKRSRDINKEDKEMKKSQDFATRRRLLQEEVEEDARRLKEARKSKRAEQNAKSYILTEEEERRRKRQEQKTKAADKDEEERRRRKQERKLKEANQTQAEEEKRKRQERKSRGDKHPTNERKKREQKTKEGTTPDKDEERRRRQERKKEGKGNEGDDEERRRQRHERKQKEESQEDEEENQRRRKRHEKKSVEGSIADSAEEEQRRKRHERKLKEGKMAEEEDEKLRRRRQEQKAKEKKQESRDIKSSGDTDFDNSKKTKKSKLEEEVYHQKEQMAEGDLKKTPLQSPQNDNKSETEVNDEPDIQDDYNYDDDDFEDYSDDFDDDDNAPENNSSHENSSPEDIKENQDRSYLSSADSRSRDSGRISSAEKSSSSVNERPAFQVMNFSNAKVQKMSQNTKRKLKTRIDDLRSLIALDVAVGQEIFELAPISEYELYIRNFGNANSNQVYVQTGDDNVDRDIQTEEIECLDKWTQHPPNGAAAYGGNSGQNPNETDLSAKSPTHDSARLNKFLLQASQVISILLEENLSSETHDLTHEKSSQLPFSKSYFTLSSCPLFQEHTIDSCCFANSTHTDYLLTVHNPPVVSIKEKNGKKMTSLGSYVALWDLRTPSRPSKILYSESAISCCFGSLKSQFVLAGCVDGAVVVWDLRESESLHKQVFLEDLEYCVRYPAYNTASVLSFNSHSSTIQTIRDIPSQIGRETKKSIQKEGFNSGFSSQLLSMDQSGLVNLWVIVELSTVDPSGCQIDLGLSPGSRIKLEHTSSINVHAAVRDTSFPTSIYTQQLCLLPKDPNQIYVATDTGHVIHSVRLGSQPYPRVHHPRKVNLSNVLSHVLCLDFSPFMAPCFLTGHSDGSVNLYHTSLECPVVTWLPSQSGSESIVSVRWSQSRPSVFYVLNDASTIFAFDLLEQDNNAACTQTYKDRLTSINVISNSEASDQKEKSQSTEKMVLCFANGRIEVHTISEAYSECQTLEMEFLENYLQRM